MKRRSILRAALAGTFATAMTAGMVAPAYAAYPERPITMIVPWGAGGGTDAVARFIASELEKDLKQPINVVNRTGGSGVVGHTAISSAAPDGYTIGVVGFYLLTANFLGFIITGAIILAVLMWSYGVAFKLLVPISIFAAVVIHLAFYKLLSVPLPWGILQPLAW